MSDVIKSYKGFDKDLKCREFQYAIGEEYQEDKAVACRAGFHACGVPLDVFTYYAPGDNRYCEVEQSGDFHRDGADSKVASTKIKIGAEIGILGLIKAQAEWVKETCRNSPEKIAQGYRGHAAAQGYRGHAAAQGNSGHAAAQGERGHAAAQGYRGHAAAQGERGHAAAQGNSGHAAAQGERGHAAAQGYRGHAEVKGKDSIAAAFGIDGAVRACQGSWIMAAEWEETDAGWQIACVLTAKVDGVAIKADTWYTVKGGKFVECE